MHINMKILFLVLTCALFRAALCDEDSLQEPISENENIEAEETNTSNEDNENDGGVRKYKFFIRHLLIEFFFGIS